MHEYMVTPVVQDATEPAKGIPGGNAQLNASPPAPAAETPRSDEARKKEAP